MIIYDDDGIRHDVVETQKIKEVINKMKQAKEEMNKETIEGFTGIVVYNTCIELIKNYTGVDV